MKLEDINQAMNESDVLKLAEVIDNRLIDGRLLFNQRDTATLLGITARAFAEWPIEPLRKLGREKFYYWQDVRDLAGERYRAQLSRTTR